MCFMKISVIAAVGKNNELGKNNDLIWHFHSDMVFFRETTTGSTVLMGRKTFESLPKALPKRKNVVITRNLNYRAEGATVCKSVEEALELCKDDEKVFVIGGGEIYKQLLPMATELYLTEVDDECSDADTFFPAFDKSKYKKEIIAENEENSIKFTHVKYSL